MGGYYVRILHAVENVVDHALCVHRGEPPPEAKAYNAELLDFVLTQTRADVGKTEAPAAKKKRNDVVVAWSALFRHLNGRSWLGLEHWCWHDMYC